MVKFKSISSNLIMCESKTMITSFVFECVKSFLSNGFLVHYISKDKLEEIPLTIHGGLNPVVDAFNGLTLKYFKTVDQLLEYACSLQYIQFKQCKYPKVIVLQDFEVYMNDESKGVLAIVMVLDALNALSKALNSPTYLLAGLEMSSPCSIKVFPSLTDNFFSSIWKINVDFDQGCGCLVKLPEDELSSQTKEIKFRIGHNSEVFLENICEYFEI